jgi:succinyl-CoA synthetase alpha subunit
MLVSSLNPIFSALSRQSLSGRLIRGFSGVPGLWIDKNSNVLGQLIIGSQKTFYRYDQKSHQTFSPRQIKNQSLHLTFQEAVNELKPSATFIDGFPDSSASIIDSIKAEIPLIVCFAEIQDSDFEGIKWHLKHSKKSRLIGPRSLGVIKPAEYYIGELGYGNETKGKIGVVGRGRTTYASIHATHPDNLGLSTAIDIGVSDFNGTNFVEAFKLLVGDEATEGILLSGYLGHSAEQELMEWLAQERRTNKPVVLFLYSPHSIPLNDRTNQLVKDLARHEVRVVFQTSSAAYTAIANHFENI